MQNGLVVASCSKWIVRYSTKLTCILQRGNTAISLVDLIVTTREFQNQRELCSWIRKRSTKLACGKDKSWKESIIFSQTCGDIIWHADFITLHRYPGNSWN